jgi:hypothetical protein
MLTGALVGRVIHQYQQTDRDREDDSDDEDQRDDFNGFAALVLPVVLNFGCCLHSL